MDEKLQDIISIISLLETDMEQEKAAEVHIRTVKVIHKMILEVLKDESQKR